MAQEYIVAFLSVVQCVVVQHSAEMKEIQELGFSSFLKKRLSSVYIYRVLLKQIILKITLTLFHDWLFLSTCLWAMSKYKLSLKTLENMNKT